LDPNLSAKSVLIICSSLPFQGPLIINEWAKEADYGGRAIHPETELILFIGYSLSF